jgi:hypothetical protein
VKAKALRLFESSGLFFNEMLAKITGQVGYKFNPRGWCSDMAGSNLQGLKNVFGEDTLRKFKGCEFHFKDCRNRHARKLRTDESRAKFKRLCDALLDAATPASYYSAKEDLNMFIEEVPQEREQLLTWVKLWKDRLGFIFQAFSPWNGTPKMNQAEVVHAGWAHKDRENMTLLDAAECHVRDSVLLETAYEGIKEGNSRVGTAPSLTHRRAKQAATQMRRANTLGDELLREDIAISYQELSEHGRQVDPNSTHRADTTKDKRCSGTRRFRSTISAPFLSRLKNANKEKNTIKVAKVLSRSRLLAVFEIVSSGGKNVYKVEISNTPTCTCEDYKQFNGKELCKHIIWVYIYVLKVDENSQIIHQITLSEDSLQEIRIDVLSLPSNCIHTNSKNSESRMERVKSIISGDRRNGEQLLWCLSHKSKKPGQNPQCKNFKCKKEILLDDLCVSVKGLQVPYQQEFAVQSTFYFCAHQACLQNLPPWSNLTVPAKIVIGENVSDVEIASCLRDGLCLSF